MESIWQDIRYGARMLWKHRLATLICAVALSLGIGANTAMFSSAEGLLLRPVAFADADRVVAIVGTRPQQSGLMRPIAPATFLEWKEQAKSFEELSASNWYSVNFTGDREPEKVQGFLVTANYFSVLGVQPQLGRPFLPEEEKPGKEQEVILSHGLWERRYADAQRAERAHRELAVLGRLQPHVTEAQAAAEMKAIAQRQAEAFPDSNKGWQLQVMSLREYASGDLTRQFTLLLLGATGFVLLIACADVANVQFARVTGRHKELAVRTALGASRSRIVRQLLIESVMLSLIGAVFGLALAKWGLTLMIANMPPDVAKYVAGWKTIGLDAGAFFFTLTIALISGILSGIMPSLFTSRGNVGEVLKESGRGSSAGRARHRLRSALVVAEVAMALVLLVGAGLLVKGFRALLTVNQNYHPESLLTLNLDLPELQYKQQPLRAAFHEQFLQRLAGIPGVQSAAIVSHLPYSSGGLIGSSPFSIAGRPSPEHSDVPSAILENVSPNYFALMNIGLRDGRTLAESDAATTQPVAVVSRSLAERYFPGDNPLGRKLQLGEANPTAPLFTVVGIVDDVHYNWIEKDAVPTLYTSYLQTPPLYASFVLRVPGDPESFASAVRAQLLTVDPDLPMYNVKSQDRAIAESIVGIEHVAVMMGIVGVIALVLASVGVYGVMSYSVSERTNEIGIRMAMGAKADDILRLVVGNGMFLTLLGVAIGMPLAFGLAKTLSSILFGVTAADPWAFIGLPLILAAVATLASYLPARRALRVDPLIALDRPARPLTIRCWLEQRTPLPGFQELGANVEPLIQLRNLEKSYEAAGSRFFVVRRVNLDIKQGEFVTIMGPSGAGKSTLLSIIGMLDSAWSGEYFFMGEAVNKLNPKKRNELHKANIGFVFQSYHLIDNLTVFENLEVPLSYKNVPRQERISLVCDTLDRFHIVGKKDLFPNQLSGGQQQLVGVARAVILNPKLILADEPTGNLHSEQGEEIMQLFKRLNEAGTTIIQVTHSEKNAAYGDRIIQLKDGWVVSETATAAQSV